MRTNKDILKDMCRAKGLRFVGSRGNPNDRVCIIGEAPGAEEDQVGLPFVGSSGKELGRMMRDAGWKGEWHELPGRTKTGFFQPTDVWFYNVYPVRPPENEASRLPEYGIPEEIFREVFLTELRAWRPRIIVAAGAVALGALCPETRGRDNNARIGTFKGSLLKSRHLDWPHRVVPCPHPAFVLRQWEDRPIAVFCLERAREEWEYLQIHNELQPLPIRKLILQPDQDTLIEYLTNILAQKLTVSVDIELLDGMPAVYGIAISPWEAISFSIWDYQEDKLIIIWRLLNEILKNCPQIGQNYVSFDASWHEWLGLEPDLRIFDSKTQDTLVMHHILWSEFPHKLEFLTMQYSREPYYKDEGRRWKPKDGIRKLMHYNSLDAAVTYEVFLAMQKELIERSNLSPETRLCQ